MIFDDIDDIAENIFFGEGNDLCAPGVPKCLQGPSPDKNRCSEHYCFSANRSAGKKKDLRTYKNLQEFHHGS